MGNELSYADLVKNAFEKAGVNPAKRVSFIKVNKKITEENFKSDFASSVIPDADTPEGDSNTLWIPLEVEAFGNVLRSMTANQAGYWAIKKCREQGWPITDWECCLNNLEIDM